ncbi:ABC-2 transporter permease [Anaerococcus sp. Marseille-Q7828]|uniref:ABC-2 transporter permease n=1 Tax=Anaerococcus sp. Marseille-Q7828 TaxID=3036300 RepID=UPI0024AD5FDC|nr:ABC-2 transporter permease [Anaerococcus sp. Marseille-Q7828]
MKALIYKDIIAFKRYFIIIGMFILLLTYYQYKQGQLLISTGFFALIPIALLNGLFDADIKSSSDKYIVGMGINKRKIVLSRYIIIWIFTGLAILIGIMGRLMANKLDKFSISLLISIIILSSTLIPLIQLPLMYKFGSQKARTVFIFIYFSIFMIVNYLWENEELVIRFLQENLLIGKNHVGLVILLIALVLNAISLIASIKIYENKEL